MRDSSFWLRSWKGADTGCKRQLLRGNALSAVAPFNGVNSIDPVVHALYKTWTIGRNVTSADVALTSYRRVAELERDTAPLWKRAVPTCTSSSRTLYE